ncbi:reverse transcriptase family protein [Paraburkholderia tropica]|uniref:reverse transcriptase family protein n=1 Tax=Paraburkholderia tropica TaxID=92647 RepID=UPI002ABE890D|nr:reverse transcriptase family protein [Paraburkholderia tropica]
MYIGPKPKPKKNGGVRYVFDTKAPLKPLLKKINSIFFRRVQFPRYLTGSLAGRDFVSNVEIHSGSLYVITEDIAKFFDHITADQVYRIWREFFAFGEEVSVLLTQLTTKDGRVFQGTPTSSYLANLAFWDREPALVERLAARNLRYSRYVDDITMSSIGPLAADDKSWAIAQAYAMIGAGGFTAQRTKHAAFSANKPIRIMGLNVNRQPTLPKLERAKIRAAVYQLEQSLARRDLGPEFRSRLNTVSGKVGRLKRLHPREGAALRIRLDQIRRTVDALPVITHPANLFPSSSEDTPPF